MLKQIIPLIWNKINGIQLIHIQIDGITNKRMNQERNPTNGYPNRITQCTHRFDLKIKKKRKKEIIPFQNNSRDGTHESIQFALTD